MLPRSNSTNRYSEHQLLQNQCEQERTQMLINLMLAIGNPRLAWSSLPSDKNVYFVPLLRNLQVYKTNSS